MAPQEDLQLGVLKNSSVATAYMYSIFATWHGNEKQQQQKAKYLWLTRCNA